MQENVKTQPPMTAEEISRMTELLPAWYTVEDVVRAVEAHHRVPKTETAAQNALF